MEIARPVRKVKSEVPILTEVCNQKTQGVCERMAIADMMTIVIRMNNDDSDLDLNLTPQIFIDTHSDYVDSIILCTDKEKGLEKISKYPFARVGRNTWRAKDYESPVSERYRISDIKYYDDASDIKNKLIKNFSEEGYHYPCVGSLRMGPFEEKIIARQFAGSRIPYRHQVPPPIDDPRHSLLIVGVDTMSDDPEEHFCRLKNTHGTKWGVDGYSKVGFEVFLSILVPIQKTPDELAIQVEWEAELAARAKKKGKSQGETSAKGKGKAKVSG